MNQNLSWFQARDNCQQEDSDLASVQNDREALEVVKVIRQYLPGIKSIWIRPNNLTQNEQWKSQEAPISRRRSLVLDEKAFAQGSETCVELIVSQELLKWNNANCDENKTFFCQMLPLHPKSPVTSSSVTQVNKKSHVIVVTKNNEKDVVSKDAKYNEGKKFTRDVKENGDVKIDIGTKDNQDLRTGMDTTVRHSSRVCTDPKEVQSMKVTTDTRNHEGLKLVKDTKDKGDLKVREDTKESELPNISIDVETDKVLKDGKNPSNDEVQSGGQGAKEDHKGARRLWKTKNNWQAPKGKSSFTKNHSSATTFTFFPMVTLLLSFLMF
ncbi:uncharacterized protein LOC119938993 [Tachyglossus aculeatus]|uniref:uncharacterized protein LOC119938993 n=1 Tax=Tachyglossus aculeatus TaxID=9261 RepID=UPI0018F3F332|nr:uncharacterized protein LOC119938993 [Tachyglossus aculeatus]